MPDQWERHGRTNEYWDTTPSRKQQRMAAANDDPVKDKFPGKKDKDKCKGNHWGPHVPSYTFQYPWYTRKMTSCGWTTHFYRGQYVPYWYCGHSGKCLTCGKRLPKLPVCPDRNRADIEPPLWVVEEAQEKTQEYLARRAKWRPRKMIKGPTHYRKPKAK